MEETKEEKKVPVIHYVVVLALCLLFRFIPGFAGITELGMGILGSFFGAIYGWIAIGLFWPSMIALLGVGLSIGMDNMLTAGFANVATFCLMFTMPMMDAIMKTGVFNWLAEKVLNSKAMQGKAFLVLWVLFMLSFVLGILSNPIIMCLLLCVFVTSICQQVGYEKNDRVPVFMYLGVPFACMLGQIMLPFRGTGLTLILAYNAMFPNSPLDFMMYMAFMLPMGIGLVTAYTLLCKFVFRLDISKLANYRAEGGVPPMNVAQKRVLTLFLLMLFLMIVMSLSLGAVSEFLTTFGVAGIQICSLCTLHFLKDGEGKPIVKLEQSLSRSVPWGMVVMVAFIMVIATYMTKQDTGISAAMAMLLQPFATLPPVAFALVMLVIASFLTNFANNMVIAIIVMPFMFSFAQTAGVAPTGMICLLFIMCQFALITPAASPIVAIAMSQEMADSKVVMKAAILAVPCLFVCGMVIGWPYVMLLFG